MNTNCPQAIDRLAYFGRVSTPRQKLIQQWELVERWLTFNGLTVPQNRRFEDKIRRHEAASVIRDWEERKKQTGRRRYQFDALMELVEARAVDWIVIASFDRWGIGDKDDIFIFRSWLRKYDVQLFSVNDELNITATDDGAFWRVAGKAEASTGYVSSMADNNIRKMVSMAQGGWATTGNNPFGVDLVCYPLNDLNRPLFRVVRMRYRPHSYRIISYTPDSRVVRDAEGFITESSIAVAKEEVSPNMPPRDKKATGYRYEPTVEARRLEALRQLFEMYDSGMDFTTISARLWEQGLGHYDKPFGYHGVETILLNSAYVGLPAWGKVGVGEYRHCIDRGSKPVKRKSTDTLTLKKEEEQYVYPTKPVFAPIIATDLFQRVKKRLKARPHVNETFGKRRTRAKATHPLNGKLVCPDCDEPMVLGSFMPGKKSHGKRFRCFHCGTWRKTIRSRCNANTVRWELLDAATEELLKVVAGRIEGVQTGKLTEADRSEWLMRTELGKVMVALLNQITPTMPDGFKPTCLGVKVDDDALATWEASWEAAFASYDEQFATGTQALREELEEINDELEGIALELPKQRRHPTVYDRMQKRAGELEARKAELEPKLTPLTGRARAIIDQLTAIRETIDQADKVKLGLLLDSFLERVEPIFDVKEVGKSKKRRTQVVGFRFVPRESARKVLPEVMELCHERTATSLFHFTASLFAVEVHFSNPTPVDDIRQLRAEGCSLAEVAERAGTTVNKVRRLVPRIDKAGLRRQQEETAKAIDALPLAWGEKAKRWQQQTGQSEATFWRVLRRLKAKE